MSGGRGASLAVLVLCAGFGCMRAGGRTSSASDRVFPPPGEDDSRAVPLDGLRNHDLFGAGPHAYRVAEPKAWSGPVRLDFDAASAPDAVALRSGALPDAPAEVRIPVGRAARTLYVLTAAYGGLDARDIAAEGALVYADGRIQPVKWMVGEHTWPAWAGATGRDADVVSLGVNPHGDLLSASLRTVPVAFPDTPVASLTVRSRPSALSFAVLEVRTSDQDPRTQGAWPEREQDEDFYVFDVRRPPQALPVTGPVEGALRVEGGRMLRPDGRPARLWGVNLVGRGALPPSGQASAWAEHVAAMGFDLARLHHIDSDDVGLVDPRRGDPSPDGGTVPALRPDGLERLDAFVDALAAAGVRVFLEGWTVRAYRAGEGVPDPQGLPLNNKVAAFFRPEWEEARKAWFRALWGRPDPRTGRPRAASPYVAAVEVANEDSLVASWHSGALERLGAAHRGVLDQRWNDWLRRRYGSDAALAAAWGTGPRAGLQPGEALALESVAREPSARLRTELWPHARAADLVRFYAELERDHNRRMVTFLRGELGVTAPIVCTSSFNVPAADAAADPCDAADLHLYWDPPAEQLVFTDQSLLAHPLASRVLERAGGCREGRPCFVSEFDHTWPGRHSQEAPLVWAAIGARQGWDAMAWFAWSHDTLDLGAEPGGSHDLQGRENTLAQLPAARFLFVSGEIPEATRRFVRWWSPPAILRDLAEAGSLWLDPQVGPRSLIDTRLRVSFDPAPPGYAAGSAPDGGPVDWDVRAGRLTVSTARLWAVVGAPEGVAGGLSVRLAGSPAVSLLSLDGRPLAEGARALLTIVERASAAGSIWGSGPSLLAWGRGPVRLARVPGTVRMVTGRGARAWALDGEGRRARPLALRRVGNAVELDTIDLRTPWVEVEMRPHRSVR